MKIEVIKPQEEVRWNFPCKGKYIGTDLVVGFSESGIGVVLNTGRSRGRYLYEFRRYWSMNQFEPIVEKEKGNNYDWNNPTFPILVKGSGEDVFTINGFDEVDNSVSITTFSFNKRVHHWCEEIARFSSEEDRNKWLRSLEILPKGTEIKITF